MQHCYVSLEIGCKPPIGSYENIRPLDLITVEGQWNPMATPVKETDCQLNLLYALQVCFLFFRGWGHLEIGAVLSFFFFSI